MLVSATAACAPNADQLLRENLARYNGYIRTQAGDSIAGLYEPGGELLATGREPLRGPEAIRTFLSGFSTVRVDSSAMWQDSLVHSDSGVVQYGGFYQAATPQGQPQVTAHGHFFAHWRRQADGRWLLRRMGTY